MTILCQLKSEYRNSPKKLFLNKTYKCVSILEYTDPKLAFTEECIYRVIINEDDFVFVPGIYLIPISIMRSERINELLKDD